MSELPVWRSMLYVPVIVPRFVAGAADRGADAIILDLEDSVPLAEKARARELVPQSVAEVGRRGADVLVRVNRPWRLLVRDLEACAIAGVRALALPKVDSPEQVAAVADIVDELEVERGLPRGGIRFVPMIETAAAVFRVQAIAASHPRVVAITVGAEDLALSAGMLPEAEGLFLPKQLAIFAARAAGILPLGFLGTVADYRDADAFRATIRRSRRIGFVGAACIHPAQIAILNDEFRPTLEEIEHAEALVAAYEAAAAAGQGAVAFEGRMIDAPVVDRARGLLRWAAAITKRELG